MAITPSWCSCPPCSRTSDLEPTLRCTSGGLSPSSRGNPQDSFPVNSCRRHPHNTLTTQRIYKVLQCWFKPCFKSNTNIFVIYSKWVILFMETLHEWASTGQTFCSKALQVGRRLTRTWVWTQNLSAGSHTHHPNHETILPTFPFLNPCEEYENGEHTVMTSHFASL